MLELLDADRRLMSCFDTNHLLTQSLEDYLQALAGRIATLHVSDYDFVDEKHVLPGEGKVAWPSLLAKLRQTATKAPSCTSWDLAPPPTSVGRSPCATRTLPPTTPPFCAGQIPAPQGDVLF